MAVENLRLVVGENSSVVETPCRPNAIDGPANHGISLGLFRSFLEPFPRIRVHRGFP